MLYLFMLDFCIPLGDLISSILFMLDFSIPLLVRLNYSIVSYEVKMFRPIQQYGLVSNGTLLLGFAPLAEWCP